MRTIRLRIFLTVWPLVVVALIAVGLQLNRWLVFEVNRLESSVVTHTPMDHSARARRLAAAWDDPIAEAGRIQEELRAEGSTGRVLVTDTAGTIVANPAGIAPVDVRIIAPGEIELVHRSREGRAVRVDMLRFRGTALLSETGTPLGYLYVVGLPGAAQPEGGRAMRELEPSALRGLAGSATRRIWITVAAAALAAALITLLVANPIVAQVRRLASAADRVRGGRLGTRVAVTSRDELGHLESTFNAMAESLEESEAAKRRMISDLSHELRTPLTNVIGLLEAMRDGLRTADAATLDSARDEALLLGALVQELQELSMLDAGVMRFDIEPLDSVEEVRRAVAACATERGPHPRVSTPAGEERMMVSADRRRLAQVLRNLLHNAMTHTLPERRVVVEVARAEPGFVAITVADDGDGIPAADLPRVWERFHRVDASRSRATGGMGLGLAVVRQLVVAMGGRVEATSRVGEGSRFTVVLPDAANNT